MTGEGIDGVVGWDFGAQKADVEIAQWFKAFSRGENTHVFVHGDGDVL